MVFFIFQNFAFWEWAPSILGPIIIISKIWLQIWIQLDAGHRNFLVSGTLWLSVPYMHERVKLLLLELRSTDSGKSSGSLCTLFICIFLCRFFNYTFIKLIFFNREKNSDPTCPVFQRKVDVSAFWTKNRRVGFSNEKRTCRLFQRKLDVSAFSTKSPRCYTESKVTWKLFTIVSVF